MKSRILPALAVAAVLFGMFLLEQAKQRRAASGDNDAKRWEREHNFSDPGDDPRFKAAEAEARRRWPEFLAAFAKREPNVAYAVKAKFVDGENVEWMWVQVESIDGETIRGRVDNEPLEVKNVRVGQRVTVRRGNTDDWLVARGGEIVQGGFTSKVLQQIDQEKRGK